MRDLVVRQAARLVSAGLAEPGDILMGGLDDRIEWNRPDPGTDALETLFRSLSINSLLCARPSEPCRSMITLLAERGGGEIRPTDCETRTFLHDIPVVRTVGEACARLRNRRSAVFPDGRIVSWGAVSPEQAFVSFSSTCFSCYVKFLSDLLPALRSGTADSRSLEVLALAGRLLQPLPDPPPLARGPFGTEAEVRRAISEAGRAVVSLGLVDSYFGNISYELGGVLYISQTASSLDDLDGAVDACPLDGSSCASITASSEYQAHVGALAAAGARGVLHGHPKFSVIMSMDCDRDGCGARGECHLRCPGGRTVAGLPVIPGEVGSGRHGLHATLPGALASAPGAIVLGHGVFTLVGDDFNGALALMVETERRARAAFPGLSGGS
jgi:ribulose-5-phosphate 4-epimerase/fuculose-1-phosphate aldolase